MNPLLKKRLINNSKFYYLLFEQLPKELKKPFNPNNINKFPSNELLNQYNNK